MRKVDFSMQTLLLGITLLLVIGGLTIDKNIYIWIGVIQLLIGCQQILSAFITAIHMNHGNAWRTVHIRIYWGLVGTYFIILAGLYFTNHREEAFLWFFSAWGIAVYYYVITIRLIFYKTERKTFLDIANG